MKAYQALGLISSLPREFFADKSDILDVDAPQIQSNIEKILEICNDAYSDDAFYGNSALNRLILLDPDIANLLTPAVVYVLFSRPDSEFMLKRSSGTYSLRQAIYDGFQAGIAAIKHMPNNQVDYSLDLYVLQQSYFDSHTRKIISSIEQVTGRTITESTEPNTTRLTQRIDRIKNKLQSQEPSSVFGKHEQSRINYEVSMGFFAILNAIGSTRDRETIDTLAQKFLSHAHGIFDYRVSHLFFDALHMQAALLSDKPIILCGCEWTYADIINKMAALLDADDGTQYPVYLRGQFGIRLHLIEHRLLLLQSAKEGPLLKQVVGTSCNFFSSEESNSDHVDVGACASKSRPGS